MGLFWTIGNYGRDAAALLNWATGINKWVTFLASGIIHCREAAAILKWCNWHLFFGQLGLRPRSGRFFEFGNWHHQ